MRDGVKVAALTAMMIWVILAAVPAAASSRVPIPPRHAQVITCSKALLSQKVMTAKVVNTCLAVVEQTYTPTPCLTYPNGYLIHLKGWQGLRGKVATTWLIRAGATPYRVGPDYSDSAINADICADSHLEPVPASVSSSWVEPPAQSPGPEGIGIPNGPELAPLANAATGETVDGIECQTNEQTLVHVHAHLTIYVNGQARVIPYGVGIPDFQAEQTSAGPFVSTGSCFYWLHAHANDGIIHIESPSTTKQFSLGQYFDEWGIPLSSTQVGPATGNVTVFFTSPGYGTSIYTGDPRSLPLGNHYEIQLDVGTPIVAPYKVTNWARL
jgi:hypothetical protein